MGKTKPEPEFNEAAFPTEGRLPVCERRRGEKPLPECSIRKSFRGRVHSSLTPPVTVNNPNHYLPTGVDAYDSVI